MQFITTDQRIAVENFDLGLIYTVTFTDGRYFLGACIGKGADFVMFQRTEPELIYCLNMTTAADVASIEPLSDDIGKILTYTGSVPTTIKTEGSPLLDYSITGNTVQNGTPTPSSPVPVVGVGELDSGQYKIPILSAGRTTPVYLGEVQSTRRIKKLVFDGAENWTAHSSISNLYRLDVNDYLFSESNIALCTHYKSIINTGAAGVSNGETCFYYGTSAARIIYIRDGNISTVADFKSYLATQYAEGTPVTVWYIIAASETGIVNEPLMRIRNYADTVSYRQSGVNVPTTDGLNVFDIDTTLKPSEVYLKYFSPLL